MLKRFRLYVLPPTPDNIDMAQERYKYYRATPWNLLIYTEKRKPVGSLLVKKTEALSGADQGWLAGCNAIILEEEAKRNPHTVENMMKFLSDLDIELGKELAKEG